MLDIHKTRIGKLKNRAFVDFVLFKTRNCQHVLSCHSVFVFLSKHFYQLGYKSWKSLIGWQSTYKDCEKDIIVVIAHNNINQERHYNSEKTNTYKLLITSVFVLSVDLYQIFDYLLPSLFPYVFSRAHYLLIHSSLNHW